MNPHIEILFNRKGHIIADASTGEIVFDGQTDGQPSINAAKRESRRLQDQHGKFCVRVVQKLLPIHRNES